ncbi:M20 metallopeptidase family protein [Chlorobium phaeobacteroides]|uniref:Amidohydrolase n=1 Tax=Chlorobium phaeobacteroides (strain DSM 266 / SMG 266 / 2430) TaxID=290317 RepID=A1BG34_CHLPD|nr:M20 family metallopeptidase [Chlorobium phaeobacteroides]ABL65361.1 amidohydrolase [Chlorobium phaeobacteroides DSM 266]
MNNDFSAGLATRIKNRASEIFPEIVSLRRDIHRHPELSYEEVRTTALITDYLLGLGITPEPPLLETGVIALIRGERRERKNNLVALRADIDALPLTEENRHGFCSLESGKMHACGHDMHTAMLLGAAKILSGMKDELGGDVLLIFQPAEEKAPGGAKPLLDAGLFRQFNPAIILGQHCFPNVETGKVALCRGSFMAATDELYFTISGQGGHASAPHKAADPVLAAAHIITAVQYLVSRVAPPHEPAVVSIASIHAGNAPNVIPGKVVMSGTMRTMNEELRSLLKEKLRQTVSHVAEGFGVHAELEIRNGYPALVNDPQVTGQAWTVCSEYLGDSNVIQSEPLMTAEDFAYYLQECPGTFWQIGTGTPDQEKSNTLHSSMFNPEERALEIGSGLFAYTAARFLDLLRS